MSNYYDDAATSFPYPERAVLLEAVKIPINTEKLTLNVFDPKLIEETKPTGSGEDSYSTKYYEFDFSKVFSFPWDMLPSGITGKFSIPILVPSTVDIGDAVDKDNSKPRQTGFKGAKPVASSYQKSNYVELTIPRYMLYQFIGSNKVTIDSKTKSAYCTIPKGTEFICVSTGAKQDISRVRIIGLYTVD